MKTILSEVKNFSIFLKNTSNHLHSVVLNDKKDINELINYLHYLEGEISDFTTQIGEEGNTINKVSGFIIKSRFEIVDIYEQLVKEEATVATKEILVVLEEYLLKYKQKLDEKIDKWKEEIEITFNESKIKKG